MTITILLFGIVSDLIESNTILIDIPKNSNITDLKSILVTKYPKLASINDFTFAVNEEYANDNQLILENDIVAIIPPVSGG